MNSDKLENIYQLLNEHNFDSYRNVPDKFKCGKCRKILIKACQTRCGCRFCRRCVDEMMENDRENCPGITSDCKFELLSTVQIDHRANRKISKLITKCPEMCSYECELSEMSEHLRTCDNKDVVCPFNKFGCDLKEMTNGKLIEHFQLENYKHNKTLIDIIEDLRVKEFNNHEEINKLKTNLQSMEEKLESKNAEMETMKIEMKDRLETFQGNVDNKIDEIESTNKKEIRIMNDKIRLEIMESCKQLIDKSILQMGIAQKINQLERNAENKMKGICEIMLDNVDEWRNLKILPFCMMTSLFETEDTSNNFIWSEYFYTQIYPYKLRLYIELFVDYFVVYLLVCDDIMNHSYTFKADVTMKIINKNNRELSESITEEDCLMERPENEPFNKSVGFAFTVSELREKGILESNCFIVQCSVDSVKKVITSEIR